MSSSSPTPCSIPDEVGSSNAVLTPTRVVSISSPLATVSSSSHIVPSSDTGIVRRRRRREGTRRDASSLSIPPVVPSAVLSSSAPAQMAPSSDTGVVSKREGTRRREYTNAPVVVRANMRQDNARPRLPVNFRHSDVDYLVTKIMNAFQEKQIRRNKWTREETTCLVIGMMRYGNQPSSNAGGSASSIRNFSFPLLRQRGIDAVRDKVRLILRKGIFVKKFNGQQS
eukprot:CAMPEP_0194259852 /NCGR_PEP_ID=MMETSP0158-20130606/44536_1 /TAXON_ID=33649 /ORGANISM="Thalassionema nitzschioides, Strain L26-B" /LENGTH=225 /DNA_ID=CAMNT_0038999799 /DNA_START=53 /DNA_END=727 /DNA_ORIENTATION=-